jgi:HSP20 family protein
MAEAATKLSVKGQGKTTEATPTGEWHPFSSLRREIDRLFDDFDGGFWRAPFRRAAFDLEPSWRRDFMPRSVPATDIAETDKGYEITAELPGMSEKDIEVVAANGVLTIKGEKKEEKEEKKKDYYLSERRYGSFERRLQIPEGVDPDKIEASFNKGVLTVNLPKKPEAQKPQKKIEIRAT